MSQKAIFFDRDNTLIIDSNYMHKIEQLRFFDDTFSALEIIKQKNYLLFMVTNQSGIGRGYFTVEQMHEFNNHMLCEFEKNNIHFESIAYCPHAPEDNCLCRKPHPTLINDLIKKYDIDTSSSFMVGDKICDAEAGKNAGIQGVLLKKNDQRFLSFDSLSDFANFL
jgi:D-glycero-D-manno-heptose 1,7-bisphosphate phosphatase